MGKEQRKKVYSSSSSSSDSRSSSSYSRSSSSSSSNSRSRSRNSGQIKNIETDRKSKSGKGQFKKVNNEKHEISHYKAKSSSSNKNKHDSKKFTDAPKSDDRKRMENNEVAQKRRYRYSSDEDDDGPADINTLIQKAKRNAQLDEAFGKVSSNNSTKKDQQNYEFDKEIASGIKLKLPTSSPRNIERKIDLPVDVKINYIGLILGPEGSNLRNIQEKTNCRIIIKNEAVPPFVLLIGRNEEDLAAAQMEIERILFCDENTRNKIKNEQLRQVADNIGNVNQKQRVVKVPIKYVGLIVGKGGDTVKLFKTQSGASYIRMEKESESDAFKEFTVFGTVEQCEKAEQLIFDYIENFKKDCKRDKFEIPTYLVALFIGKNGCNTININKSTGARLSMSKTEIQDPSKPYQYIDIVGNEEQIETATHLATNLLIQLKRAHPDPTSTGENKNNKRVSRSKSPPDRHRSSFRDQRSPRYSSSYKNDYHSYSRKEPYSQFRPQAEYSKHQGQEYSQYQTQDDDYQQQQKRIQQMQFYQYYQSLNQPHIEEIVIEPIFKKV